LVQDVLSQRQEKTNYNLNQPKVEGEGGLKTRGLAESTEARAIATGLDESLGDLPQYRESAKAPHIEKAIKHMDKDFDSAVQIAMGEKKAPKGEMPETYYVAVNERANKMGDSELIRRLAQHSELVKEGTIMGQRLSMLAEVNPSDAISAIKAITRERENMATKRQGKNVKTKVDMVVKEGDVASKMYSATKDSVKSFLDSIKC